MKNKRAEWIKKKSLVGKNKKWECVQLVRDENECIFGFWDDEKKNGRAWNHLGKG